MKKVLTLVMAVLATCVGLTWGGVTAEAASPFNALQKQSNVTKFKAQGDGAVAQFASSDDCGSSEMQVIASNETSKEGSGKSEFISRLFLTIHVSNYCTGLSIDGNGISTLSPENFSFGDKLDSATLNAVVDVCCNGIEIVPVTVNLTWTATGPLEKGKSSFTTKSPGCKTTFKTQGESRLGVAIGSITALGSELAPQPPWLSALSSVKSGEVEIGCD